MKTRKMQQRWAALAAAVFGLYLTGGAVQAQGGNDSLTVAAWARGPFPSSPVTNSPLTIDLNAEVLNPPQAPGSGYGAPLCPINGPFWTRNAATQATAWSLSVQYSATDPTALKPPPANSFGYMISQPSDNSAQARLTFLAGLPGWWSIDATAHVSYNNGSCGRTWRGYGSLPAPVVMQLTPGAANSLVVTAQAGPTRPSWAEVGQETVTPVVATLDNPPPFVRGPGYLWS